MILLKTFPLITPVCAFATSPEKKSTKNGKLTRINFIISGKQAEGEFVRFKQKQSILFFKAHTFKLEPEGALCVAGLPANRDLQRFDGRHVYRLTVVIGEEIG